MADWQMRIYIDSKVLKPGIFSETMNIIWKVAKVAKVSRNADWRCFKRGNNYFFHASWDRATKRLGTRW